MRKANIAGEARPGPVPGTSLARAFKSACKRVPVIYRAHGKYLGWRQSRRIEREQAEYEARARELGLSPDWDSREAARRLRLRLEARGLSPQPRAPGELHVVYASRAGQWDVYNIAPALAKFGQVSHFLLPEGVRELTPQAWLQVRDRLNDDFSAFVAQAQRRQPVDLVLTYYSGHQVGPEIIQKINAMGMVSAAFHLDDRLLFRGELLGGRFRGPAAVARAYDLNLTQAPESLVKYRVEGGIPLLWPLAANPELCYPRETPCRYDVSFVGTAYGNRISTIDYLRRRGVEVAAFGLGWPGGYLPPDKFQEIYCASRINLNFDEIGYSRYQCGKLRDFEVPMCGGLMLSTHNPHLKNYFELDAEIFTFRNPRECLAQIKGLLADEPRCARARRQARARALKDHTWEARVKDLLQVIGFMAPPA